MQKDKNDNSITQKNKMKKKKNQEDGVCKIMIKNILQEGFILKERGYYKHAIESFYKALEIDNSSDELMLEIADCYYLLQDEERALGYIEQVLATNPTHIGALKFLMNIFVSL